LSVPDIITVSDGSYKSLLAVSSVISAATVLFLLYLVFRYRRTRRDGSHDATR
jgi:hypothetical protein